MTNEEEMHLQEIFYVVGRKVWKALPDVEVNRSRHTSETKCRLKGIKRLLEKNHGFGLHIRIFGSSLRIIKNVITLRFVRFNAGIS